MSEELRGGYNAAPVRVGDEVRRRSGPWHRNVGALLDHLRANGFDRLPEIIDSDGKFERLRWVEGQSGTYPLAEPLRAAPALREVAATIRALHDAAAGFVAPEPDRWQHAPTVTPATPDCVGHNDLGPYNMVFQGSAVLAIIDWDNAGPSTRAWDLCYAAHRFVPLSAPRSTRAFGWDSLPDQGARLADFVAAYGTDRIDGAELLDLLPIRLGALAARIEKQARAGDPAFARHHEERHAEAYREDTAYVLSQRERWLKT